MSLLDGGGQYEPCTFFPEELVIDSDGNKRTQASKVGIPTQARFDILGQSGTSSRRQEQDNEGYESEKVYSIRFPRSFKHVVGAQSEIEWRGERWYIFGDANRYNRSRRTRHTTYTIKRY
ncbi:Uncharacterised protein [Mycobacteroides abscessus subsp. abscessus]|uniref:hypothetical protein n=1 Tax=Mycobacteroides abscessus TaxID=36809 RepID=UPI000929689C|nr:hypothetical protein [Mycobacteroides abscessus]SHS98034.1 Uncharacterised protein [Mycobacteroides abscessus subsp. abscessus]SLK65007.1 Uncharacterised protein [Mycobacteroides abscessus subsp. abscessus]